MIPAQLFGLSANQYDTTTTFYAGMECEIESVQSNKNIGRFLCTEDGSLRNHGWEFISIPLTRPALLDAFIELHSKLVFFYKTEAFSPRTSTHVHINCRSLDEETIRNLVLMYAIYEEVLFSMVDRNRKDNIHCVPLTETVLSHRYKFDLCTIVGSWHKYTALNIIPLSKLGTIEFRHLQGTDDTELVDEWLRVLENLWLYSQVVKITPEFLCSKEQIHLLFDKIFCHSRRIMGIKPGLDQLIARSIIDVKFGLI